MKKVVWLSACISFFITAQAQQLVSSLNNNANHQQLLFVENRGQVIDMDGQAKPDVLYTTESNGVKVYISKGAIYYQWKKRNSQKQAFNEKHIARSNPSNEAEIFRLDMYLENSNTAAKVIAGQESEYYENFYLANCPQGITNVPTFSRLTFQNVYPQIDWVLYSKNGKMEYDFIVHPGGNPTQISIRYKHAGAIQTNKKGDLNIVTQLGELTEASPISYISETGKSIKSNFKVTANQVKFILDNYDPTQTLVIDPTLQWSSYYGGTGTDYGYGCSTDTSGNIFMSGETDSNNGIASVGGFQTTHASASDAFVVKFNAAGARQWATYYGGNDTDIGQGCAADAGGNVYVSGFTSSVSGMASGGFQNSFIGGQYDCFLAKFNAAGARVWATYYGGFGDDVANNCAIDNSNNIYLCGSTNSSTGLATPNSYQASAPSATIDGFLAKFNSSGARIWGTYFGDGGDDRAYSCTSDALGNVFLCGSTSGLGQQISGGFQSTFGGLTDAFIVKFTGSGTFQWSSYYGDIDTDIAFDVAVDYNNNVFLCGQTNSSFSIASSGFQNSYGGGPLDAFVAKFDPAGNRLWGTYYGSGGNDYAITCSSDSKGNVFIAGETSSTSGIASNAVQTSFGGGAGDILIAGFNALGQRIFGTYLGGNLEEYANAITLDKNNDIVFCGTTQSTTGIATNGFQNTFGGGTWDGVIAKIDGPCNAVTAAISYNGTAYACANHPELLSALSGTGFSYQWFYEGSAIAGATAASYSATQGGNYFYLVTSLAGCRDSSAVLFIDSIPPAVQLCICTVDSLSKYNVLVWEKPVTDVIDSFRIYREDITNVFSYVKSVSYNQLSLFVDSNLLYANPNVTSKLYKLSTVDACGTESAKSDFHHTIKLNDQSNGNFDWNFYQIQNQTTPVLQYLLLRDSISSGVWRTIAITSGNVNQISDPDYNLFPNASYRLVTNMGGLSCTPTLRTLTGINTSKSNIKNKAVGITENKLTSGNLILTPNPASKSVLLKSTQQVGVNSVQIFDKLGNVVFTKIFSDEGVTEYKLDIAELASAIYVVVVKGENFTLNKKLVVVQ